MLGNHKPRERYKDHYKPPTGGIDAIHIMDTSAPVTAREKVIAAICDYWETTYPISREHRFGSNIIGIVEKYSDDLCEAMVAPPGGSKDDAALCIQLASEACPAQLLESFIALIPQQEENSRTPLFMVFKTLLHARRGNLPMREPVLTDMTASIETYSISSQISRDDVLALFPDITESEARCITLVHSRPELSGILAERLAVGDVDAEMIQIIADNPANALNNGTL
jgi:hypothetical protein